MRSYTIQTENWDETLIGCFYQLFLFMETEMNLFLFSLNIWREFKWKVIMRFFRIPEIQINVGEIATILML